MNINPNETSIQKAFSLAENQDNPDIKHALMFVVKALNTANRNIAFDLSFPQYKRLMTLKKCQYTGLDFEENGPNSRTLDRFDADIGYTAENTKACTDLYNNLKNAAFENGYTTDIATFRKFLDTLEKGGFVPRGSGTNGIINPVKKDKDTFMDKYKNKRK